MWLGLRLFYKSAEPDVRVSALAWLCDDPSRHLVSPRHAILLFPPRIPSDGRVCATIRGSFACMLVCLVACFCVWACLGVVLSLVGLGFERVCVPPWAVVFAVGHIATLLVPCGFLLCVGSVCRLGHVAYSCLGELF